LLNVSDIEHPEEMTRNLNYMQIDIIDCEDEDIKKYFMKCYTFINKAKESKNVVLVHCAAGISRSATVVISYIMKEYKLNYEKAYVSDFFIN
jgi:protein-tyrosine phosphatase